MALPKAIDFSGLTKEHVFNSDSKQYKLLNQIPDDNWGNYCNKMLGKGVSVTYDAEMDHFTAKPQKLKVKESLMQNKRHLKEWYDEDYFEGPDNPQFNANDFKQIEELCFLLSNDGVDEEAYPKWLFKELIDNDFIEESDNYGTYFFTEYGKQHVGNAKQMQNFLLSDNTSYNDSEKPYLRGREQMESKEIKKKSLEQGDKVKFYLKENEIITGTIQWINEDDSYELMLPDGSLFTLNENEIKEKHILYEGNHRFKSDLNEDERRSLLYDQDEDEDGNLPEETSTEEDEIESKIEDEEEPNFDDEVSSFLNGVDDDTTKEEEIVDDTMNKLDTKGIDAPRTVSMDDLETVLRKILGNRDTDDKEQYPNSEATEVKETVPALGQGPQENILQTEFSKDTTLTQTDTLDTDVLKAVYGHEDGEVLDKEFQEINDDISNIKDRIENQPSYQQFLTGESDEVPDLYNYRKDGYGDDEEYLADDADFERNAELSGGLGAYSTSEETGDIFEETGSIESLPSISANSEEEIGDDPESVTLPQPPVESVPSGGMDQVDQPVTVNKIIQCSGMPIQIVLSGVMLTMQDVSSIVESVDKKGLRVSKIESNKRNELNIIVESNDRKYKIHYLDVAASKNQMPFSIKHERFNSLTEACDRIKTVSKQRLNEKDNFIKFNDKDILNRTINNPKESTILKETKANKNYVSSWSVRSVGTINLKSGLNEVFSNITNHSKAQNTLIKTKDGQYYLIKGNLKEGSKVGTTKELVDIQGQKSYGIGRVIGVYENSIKGLGRIMYHTRRTSLPLLIWK